MAKTLIAFFSRADENYFGGAMRYVKVGNTEIVVGFMKELIEEESRAHREAQVPHAPRTEIMLPDSFQPVLSCAADGTQQRMRTSQIRSE